jgi:polysaccharide chain length determinant protein (PEP-CTERM system associated)
VSYTGAEPKTVMQVTQRLASLFIDENLRDREVMADASFRFIESQLSDARVRLVEHEKQLEAYRLQHAGELPSQLDANLRVIQNAELQLQALNETKARNLDRRIIVERTLADLNAPAPAAPVAPPAAPGPAGDLIGQGTAEQQLEAAQEALRQLLLRLTPVHPDVIRMQRVIATLQEQAGAERLQAAAAPAAVAAPANPAETARLNRLREAQDELENIVRQEQRFEADERRLRSVIADYQARVEAAPSRESELIALTRDYDTLRQTYASLLSKQEDAKIAANLERRQIGEQFKVLDPAQLPERPTSPDRMRLNAMGIVVGLVLGLGVALLLELGDTTFKSDDDVTAALNLRVLALVPVLGSVPKRRASRAATAASVALAWLAGAVMIWRMRA